MSISRHASPQHRNRNLTAIMLHYFMVIHIWLYRRTGGVIGGKAGNLTFLLLMTTGRKSGIARIIPIFCIPDDGRFLLIASNWGSEKDPQWWLNLQVNPHATVQVGRRTFPITARKATPEERAHMWPKAIAHMPQFANYQKRIKREIPIVILTPDTQAE